MVVPYPLGYTRERRKGVIFRLTPHTQVILRLTLTHRSLRIRSRIPQYTCNRQPSRTVTFGENTTTEAFFSLENQGKKGSLRSRASLQISTIFPDRVNGQGLTSPWFCPIKTYTYFGVEGLIISDLSIFSYQHNNKSFQLIWAVLAVDETSGNSDWPSAKYIARSFGQGVEVTYNSPRTTLSDNLTEYLGIDMIININYISGKSEWLRPHEPMILSHREASLRPEHAWRARDHFGTVSVRHRFSPVQASP